METFIVAVGLLAAAGGMLMLLSCLSGKRAQLVKAFNIQQEMEECRRRAEKNLEKAQNKKAAVSDEINEQTTELG